MQLSSIKLAAVAVLPMLAQTSTCNPSDIWSNVLNPDVVLVGQGTFDASGSGTVTLRGSGTIQVTATGRTGLVIFDAAGVDYQLDGEGATYWYEGHLVVDGMLGSATIQGASLRVGLHGGPMEIHAEGQGRITLSGEGEFSTGGDKREAWTDQEQAAVYAAPGQKPDVAEILAADIKATRDYIDLIERVREALRNPDAIVGGTGTLHAEGSGSARVTGAGVVMIEAQGQCGLVIFDAANVNFELAGEGRTKWRGDDLIAEGIVGTAYVEGENLRVVVTGGPMTLDAEGTGRARLSGEGWYETNSGVPEGIEEAEAEVAF